MAAMHKRKRVVDLVDVGKAAQCLRHPSWVPSSHEAANVYLGDAAGVVVSRDVAVGNAQGIVLGVVADLDSAPDQPEEGVLRRGDAIMLYTDGLVEASGRDIDEGIARLLGEADHLVVAGFRTGAPELVTAMQRAINSSDDCALVLIWRS